MAEQQTDHRAAERYFVNAPVAGSIGAMPFSGQLKDISATGAAVIVAGDVGFENDQFVNLHMQGMGDRSGYIRRRIPDGFAFQFETDENEEVRKREVQEMLRALGPGALRG
ncbi:MAG: PilZ domain-containing protein [Rhodospirillales bacterium]